MTRLWLTALVVLVTACGSPGSPSAAEAAISTATVAPSPAGDVGPSTAGVERLAAASLPRPPSQPALAAAFMTVRIADDCADRDLEAPTAGDGVLTALDRSYGLPAEYAPTDLVPASAAGFGGASASRLVRSLMVSDLAALRVAAEALGLEILIDSGYRSYEAQQATFDLWTARLGAAAATQRTARPGHSEHQLGTALDLSSPGWTGRFGDWAVESAEGSWMAAHGWEYGLVMSYPAGADAQTCFSYEPWHYRWIGREAAAAHHASGLALRQFLERYRGG